MASADTFTYTGKTHVVTTNEPSQFGLLNIQPNPFNAYATISYALPTTGNARIVVYSATGQIVETLVEETVGAGPHSLIWHAGSKASGVYLILLEACGKREVLKATVMK